MFHPRHPTQIFERSQKGRGVAHHGLWIAFVLLRDQVEGLRQIDLAVVAAQTVHPHPDATPTAIHLAMHVETVMGWLPIEDLEIGAVLAQLVTGPVVPMTQLVAVPTHRVVAADSEDPPEGLVDRHHREVAVDDDKGARMGRGQGRGREPRLHSGFGEMGRPQGQDQGQGQG